MFIHSCLLSSARCIPLKWDSEFLFVYVSVCVRELVNKVTSSSGTDLSLDSRSIRIRHTVAEREGSLCHLGRKIQRPQTPLSSWHLSHRSFVSFTRPVAAVSVPGVNLVTPEPTLSTTPAASWPRTIGNGLGLIPLWVWNRYSLSVRQTLAAITCRHNRIRFD